LRGYELEAVALAGIELGVYPWASSTATGAPGWGLSLAYQHVPRIVSSVGERQLTTLALAGRADIVYAAALGPLTLTPGVGYDLRLFSVAEDLVPDVLYQCVRVTLGIRLWLSRFFIEVGGAAKRPLATGNMGSAAWYQGLSGVGYELRASTGVRILNWLDLVLQAGFDHYYFWLGPTKNPSAPGWAEAVSDRYTFASFGLVFLLPPRSP